MRIENIIASLKRLFAPRTRPRVESIERPTTDRPPPSEPAPSREPAAIEPTVEAPVSASEPDKQVPRPAPEPASTFPHVSDEDAAIPSAAADRSGEGLVLTLATPAATFTIAKAGATLGRGQENTVRLDDLSVSRRHARIAYRQGGYWLSDLGSMGGTWIDGTRLNAPHRVAAGQVIDIGLCRLTVSFTGGAAKAEPKKSASGPRSEMTGQGRRRR